MKTYHRFMLALLSIVLSGCLTHRLGEQERERLASLNTTWDNTNRQVGETTKTLGESVKEIKSEMADIRKGISELGEKWDKTNSQIEIQADKFNKSFAVLSEAIMITSKALDSSTAMLQLQGQATRELVNEILKLKAELEKLKEMLKGLQPMNPMPTIPGGGSEGDDKPSWWPPKWLKF